MRSFRNFQKSNTKKKYNSKRVQFDGHWFDSKAELEFYHYARMVENSGKIKIIELQPKVYMTLARILYKPDFLIEQNGKRIYIDVKGMQTALFNLKLRLWAHYGEGTLRLVKKNGFGFDTIKEVVAINKG